MTRLLRIENCDECLHRSRYGDRCYAVWPYKEFEYKFVIPDWCPLPDADAENANKQVIAPRRS